MEEYLWIIIGLFYPIHFITPSTYGDLLQQGLIQVITKIIRFYILIYINIDTTIKIKVGNIIAGLIPIIGISLWFRAASKIRMGHSGTFDALGSGMTIHGQKLNKFAKKLNLSNLAVNTELMV